MWVAITVAACDLAAAGVFVSAGVAAVNPAYLGSSGFPRVVVCLIGCAGGGLLHLAGRVAAAWLRIYKREAGLIILVEDFNDVDRAS